MVKETLIKNYLNSAYERFVENNGRLMIAEPSKSLAAKELNYIISKTMPESLLCVVEDVQAARELLLTLIVYDDIKLITSSEQFYELFTAKSIAEARQNVKAFTQANKRLIITLKDNNGESVFNKKLFENKNNIEVYSDCDKSVPYCISDFLSECEYSFVAIDNIYNYINIKNMVVTSSSKHNETVPPNVYDRIDFRDKSYFIETEYSFKRLNNVTAMAKNCVLLSDVITVDEIVPFYLVTELLNNRFSVTAARRQIESSDYDYCDDICNEIIISLSDHSVLSKCMAIAGRGSHFVPQDIAEMDNFIRNKINYMTSEELFIRVVNAYRKSNPNASVENVLDTISVVENVDITAKCIVNIFFANPIKKELEELSTTFVGNMKKTEIARIKKVFDKFGIYHAGENNNGCRIPAIYRENSGFEYLSRMAESTGGDNVGLDKITQYSVLGSKSEWYYKLLALKNMMTGRDNKIKLSTPLLVVTDGDNKDVADGIKEFMPADSVSENYRDLSDDHFNESKQVVICDYEQLKKSPLWLINIKDVVLIDITPNIYLFHSIVRKLSLFCEHEMVAFTSYGTLDGYMCEHWLKNFEVFGKKELIPISFGGFVSENEKRCDYAKFVHDINNVYVGLADIVNSKVKTAKAVKVAEDFNSLLTDYTLLTQYSISEITTDMEALTKLSYKIAEIFDNTISIGGLGEEVITLDKDGKTVKNERKQFFNTCVKYLRRQCDLKTNDCATCVLYTSHVLNDYECLKEDIKNFYKETNRIINAKKRESLSDGKDTTIRGVSSDDGASRKLTSQDVVESQMYVDGVLELIDALKGDKQGIFSVPHSMIVNILDSIVGVYAKLINKYYLPTMSLYSNVSKQIVENYQTIVEGFDSNLVD